jgi:hypothetical protein
MKIVRCLDCEATDHLLETGEIYQVISESFYDDSTYYILQGVDCGGDGWIELRFEVLSDQDEAVSVAITRSVSRPLSHECPCGLVRAFCEYHKP